MNLRSLFFVLIFATGQAQAANVYSCQNLFVTSPVQNYIQQVVASKGLRLLVKDSKEISAETRWGGLLRLRPDISMDKSWRLTRYLRYMVKTLPLVVFRIDPKGRFELKPLKAGYENLVVKPSNWISEKLTGQKKEPAFFARASVAMALSFLAWNHIDARYTEELQKHMVQNIQQNESVYQHLINDDFRYRQIKADFDKGKISMQKAEQDAYWVELAYADYYKNRDANLEKTPTLDGEMKLINHLLFKHLKPIIADGVKPQPGFIIPDNAVGPIREDQKMELFKINHILNLRYQLIPEMVNSTPLYESIKNDPEISKLLSQSFDSEFGQKLLILAGNKKISPERLSFYLQEDAYWQARFQEWATINVIKLKKINGQYTNQPLAIRDIQSEILAEINQTTN